MDFSCYICYFLCSSDTISDRKISLLHYTVHFLVFSPKYMWISHIAGQMKMPHNKGADRMNARNCLLKMYKPYYNCRADYECLYTSVIRKYRKNNLIDTIHIL